MRTTNLLKKKCLQNVQFGPYIKFSKETAQHHDPWPFTTWDMDTLGLFPLTKGQILNCDYRLLNQIDRNKVIGHHHGPTDTKVLLEKYNMSSQTTTFPNY